MTGEGSVSEAFGKKNTITSTSSKSSSDLAGVGEERGTEVTWTRGREKGSEGQCLGENEDT